MTDDDLREYCRRRVADGLIDVLRRRDPDLTFKGGVREGNRFRTFPTGSAQVLRLEPRRDESVTVATPDTYHPDKGGN